MFILFKWTFPQCPNTHSISQIRNLLLAHWPMNFSILRLIDKMPHLNQLSLDSGLRNLLEKISYQVFDQIRTLRLYEIHFSTHGNDDGMENLFAAFPHLKYLYISCFCSANQIIRFLHGFKHLSAAFFSCIPTLDGEFEGYDSWNTEIKLEQMRCAEGLNFTYRFDSSNVVLH